MSHHHKALVTCLSALVGLIDRDTVSHHHMALISCLSAPAGLIDQVIVSQHHMATVVVIVVIVHLVGVVPAHAIDTGTCLCQSSRGTVAESSFSRCCVIVVD